MGLGEKVRRAFGTKNKSLEIRSASDIEKYLDRIRKARRDVEEVIERKGGTMYDEELEMVQSMLSATKATEDVLVPILSGFEDARDDDSRWLRAHRDELATKYAGEGVLIKDAGIVDHDTDTLSLLRRNDFTKKPGFVLTVFPKKQKV